MKNLTEVKFDLPIYWATYIMYADESGLEEGEKEIIDYSNNLIWAIDGYDLKGHDALCEEAYEDLGCKPI